VGGTCKNKPGGGVSDSEKISLLFLALFVIATDHNVAQDATAKQDHKTLTSTYQQLLIGNGKH
jgi:hypothetical protein